MSRFFTLDEAHRTLEELRPQFARALALRAEMKTAEAELQSIVRKVNASGGMNIDREHVGALRQAHDSIAKRLQGIIDSFGEMGCLVKDLDAGLLDFPTLYRGREVYLCWHSGEDRIEFWHEIDAGFRGRKPIDDEFLHNHTGSEQ